MGRSSQQASCELLSAAGWYPDVILFSGDVTKVIRYRRYIDYLRMTRARLHKNPYSFRISAIQTEAQACREQRVQTLILSSAKNRHFYISISGDFPLRISMLSGFLRPCDISQNPGRG
jgi:hypothetical protein